MSTEMLNLLRTDRQRHLTPLNELMRLRAWYQPRFIPKQSVHILQRQLRGLREYQPEEDSVRKVKDAENDIKAPATNVSNGRSGNLTDHRIESKGDHRCDGDTFRSGLCVEDLSADNPGQGADCGAIAEVVAPGHDNECPASGVVVCCARGELSN